MPVGRPVASCIIAENSTGFDQCRNGANVTDASSMMCPPNETPTAHGEGNPAIIASSEQSMVNCFMTSITIVRRIVLERQIVAAGHDLPERVYCDRSDMGCVDFHADERARIGDDAQSGLRTAATFRIFFLD